MNIMQWYEAGEGLEIDEGRWNFNEESGNYLIDSLGQYNGAIGSDILKMQPGLQGFSYFFNGSGTVNNRITFHSNLGLTSFPFSFRIYLKTNGINGVIPIISGDRLTVSYDGFTLVLNTITNVANIRYGDGISVGPGNRKSFTASIPPIGDDNWHKVAIELVDFNTINLYIDSVQCTVTYLSGTATFAELTDALYILCKDSSVPVFMDIMDIYNRLLTEDEK